MEFDINKLKKEYEKYENKYSLPSFEKLNEDFEIGKIDKDVGAFLRSVRKTMMEKIINSLGFVEMFLNPMNVPRIYLPYLKTMDMEDKKIIEKLYNVLSELSLLSLEREIRYSEKGEAELIKKVFNSWNELKNDIDNIIKNIKNPKIDYGKKERSYFG